MRTSSYTLTTEHTAILTSAEERVQALSANAQKFIRGELTVTIIPKTLSTVNTILREIISSKEGGLDAIFYSLDQSREGTVSRKEFSGIFPEMGTYLQTEKSALFDMIDVDKSGEISLIEFKEFMFDAEVSPLF